MHAELTAGAQKAPNLPSLTLRSPFFAPKMIITLSLTLCDFCDFALKKSDSLKPPGDVSKSRLRKNAQVMF